MQPLRALLLLLVISTTLFHLVDSSLPAGVTVATNAAGDAGNAAKGAGNKIVGGAPGVVNDGSKGVNDLKEGGLKEGGKLADAGGKGFNDGKEKLGGAANDVKDKIPCVGGVGVGCPAAAISSLLSLAVVMLVALFSRQ